MASAPRVEVLPLAARPERHLRNRDVVVTLAGFLPGRPDVGCAAAPRAEGPVAVVTDDALPDDLAVAVAVCALVGLDVDVGLVRKGGESCVRGSVFADVAGSCEWRIS